MNMDKSNNINELGVTMGIFKQYMEGIRLVCGLQSAYWMPNGNFSGKIIIFGRKN